MLSPYLSNHSVTSNSLITSPCLKSCDVVSLCRMSPVIFASEERFIASPQPKDARMHFSNIGEEEEEC